MILKPLNTLGFLAAALAGWHLYSTKHEAALLDRELRVIARDIDAANERTQALAAEWAWLNEPERLRSVAQRHLSLEPMQPAQFLRLNEAERRMPAALAFTGPPALFAAREPAVPEGALVSVALLPRLAPVVQVAHAVPVTPVVAPVVAPLAAPAAAPGAISLPLPAAPKPAGSLPAAPALAARPAEPIAAVPVPPARPAEPAPRPIALARIAEPAARPVDPQGPLADLARASQAPRPPAAPRPAPRPVAEVAALAPIAAPRPAPAPIPAPAQVASALPAPRAMVAAAPRPAPTQLVAAPRPVEAPAISLGGSLLGGSRPMLAPPVPFGSANAATLGGGGGPVSTAPDDPFGNPAPPSPHAAPAGRALPSASPARALVRVAAPELARRAQMERTRGRLVLAAGGFALLFTAVGLKLSLATILDPMTPRLRAAPVVPDGRPNVGRAAITDRNGEVLAVSLQVTELYANPQEINDPVEAADKLLGVLPTLDRERLIARITQREVPGTDRQVQFAYIARNLPPRQQQAINNLGIPGFHFRPAERRFYPQGAAAAHALGQVDVDGHGIAGVERHFDQRLRDDRNPLRLSIDVRVQVALREAVGKAIADFNGVGGAGILLDINTAEVLAMVSLPDFDASDPGGLQRRAEEGAAAPRPVSGTRIPVGRSAAAPTAVPQDRDPHFNRVTVGLYEPGSTFKLFTAAMALDSGAANIWSTFDASRPIRYGRFTISDYKGKNRVLMLPEVLAYSSNLGAAHMALLLGPQRHREFMGRMGMLARLGLEVPETARPMAPGPNSWRDINTMTIAFGHGISVSPLHVVTGVSALANGGILRPPTLVAQPDGATREGTRVISERTSETMRRLMRLVVTDGSGKGADVPGYFVGGKTGTAEKNGPHGYIRDKRVAAFVGAFPMNAPRYAIYVMVDEPKPNAQSHGYATAGWVAAPAAGAVIRRVAPILGLVPETERIPQIQQTISIPLQPGRPAAAPRAPQAAAPAPRNAPAAAPGPVLTPPAALPQAPPLRRTDAPIGLPPLRLVGLPAATPPVEAGLAPR